MSKTSRIKAALLFLLVGAAAAGPPSMAVFGWLKAVCLAFGALNVLASVPGGEWLRAIAIAASVGALLWPAGLGVFTLLLALIVWGPVVLAIWANSSASADPGRVRTPAQEAAGRHARVGLCALIGGAAVASIAYRALVAHNLQQTSALFIGLPALLAMVVVTSVSPRSATGVACKAVTVTLLVTLIFLWEGVVCVLMAAPLFYGVTVVIASSIDMARRRRGETSTTVLSCLVVLAMVPMSLEGITPLTTVSRDESVVASRVVHAPAAAVQRALLEPPRFERGRPRPAFLRLGFPTPTTSRIETAAHRRRWVVQLRGGEMFVNGMESRTGDLTLDLEEARNGLVRWRAVSDTSHMTHFLRFREAIVRWEPIDAATTRVTWTLRYDRGLDPSWYFGPMERYAATLAASYLIDAVATP